EEGGARHGHRPGHDQHETTIVLVTVAIGSWKRPLSEQVVGEGVLDRGARRHRGARGASGSAVTCSPASTTGATWFHSRRTIPPPGPPGPPAPPGPLGPPWPTSAS